MNKEEYNVKCEHCQLRFEDIALSIQVREIFECSGIEEDKMRLFCPACGKENWLSFQELGLFYHARKRKFFHWASTQLKAEKGVYSIRLSPDSACQLLIPEDNLELLSIQSICYPNVPVFRQQDGTQVLPRYPIRKEYLEFLDLKRSSAGPDLVQGKYKTRFYMIGRVDPVDVSLPLVPVRTDADFRGQKDIFSGINLLLWPNVAYKEWRRYFLRFECVRDRLGELNHESQECQIFARGLADLDAKDKEWVPFTSYAPDGFTRFACLESRPEFIALEFVSKARQEVIGGGLLEIPAASSNYGDAIPLVSVDFGTSNTLIAWKDIHASSEEEKVKTLPSEKSELFLLHGGDLPFAIDFPDTWPLRGDWSKNRSLLPSEILSRRPMKEVRLSPEMLKKWKPVVDFGLPSFGLPVNYPEQDHLVVEFKWKDLMPDEALRSYCDELRKRYLEYVLLCALAELARKQVIGRSVSIRFSYPLAFSEEDCKAFEDVVLRDVAQALQRQTGIEVKMELSLDESRAAASSIGQLAAGYAAYLYVDIGGGSTDIALEVVGDQREARRKTYVASVKYAGTGLVYAYDKGGCLRPDCDINKFRRLIREAGNVAELRKLGTVFDPHKENPIISKTDYFYGYLREFLARLLAAHILNGDWLNGVSESERAGIMAEGYEVALFGFGNGWGFGKIIDPGYIRDVFAERLTDRVTKILDEARSRPEMAGKEIPRLKIEGKEIAQPKRAVAEGLLKASSSQREAREDWTFRTILGWTAQIGRQRKVPWYRPITNRDRCPEGEEPISNISTVDCPAEEWPIFPAGLSTPQELDRDFNTTRKNLSDACLITRRVWLVQSPFHILLEQLFKPKLKEMI
jgi:hypothetical protein